MEKKLARDFNLKVVQIIDDPTIRLRFFEVLKTFHQEKDLTNFVDELKGVLREPKRLPLFEDIRPLVPVHLQMEYNRLIPEKPSSKLRHVTLQRRPNRSLGFSVRGGLEHGVGLYVSEVLIGSQAEEAGLCVGDELVTVDGYMVAQAIHQEALLLVRQRSEVEMRVKYVGMLPVKESADEDLSWMFVEKHEQTQNPECDLDTGVTKLSILLSVGSSLGCSICSGPTHSPGIFLYSVRVGGLAEEAGLEVGDQLIDVNGTALIDTSHSQAIVALKGSRMLDLTIKKGTGFAVFGPRGIPPMDSESQLSEEGNNYLMSSSTPTNQPDSNGCKSISTTQKPLQESNNSMMTPQNPKVPSSQKPFSKTGEPRHKSQRLLSVAEELDADSLKPGNKDDIITTGKSMGKLEETRDLYSSVKRGSKSLFQGEGGSELKYHGNLREGERVSAKWDGNGIEKKYRRYKGNMTKKSDLEQNLGSFEHNKNEKIKDGGDKDDRQTKLGGKGNGEGRVANDNSSVGAEGYFNEVLKESIGGSEGTEVHITEGDSQQYKMDGGMGLEKNSSKRKKAGPVLIAVNKLDNELISRQRDTEDISVDTTKPQQEGNTKTQTPLSKVSPPMAATYMTDKQNPSFRIQKPVLLHPTQPLGGDRVTTVTSVQGEWTPHRLFTNEQIAGRQVQLVTIHKSHDWTEVGVSLSTEVLPSGGNGLVVTEVMAGSPIHVQGGVHVGDELLMINCHSVTGLSISSTQKLLQDEYTQGKENIQLVVAKALPTDTTQQVTYF